MEERGLAGPPIYNDVGIIYKGAVGWPAGLTHDSKEPFEIGAHKLPGFRAYVVEVVARRLRLLDPTQDIDALRIQLADLQAIIHVGMSAKGKNKAKLYIYALKAYKLWGDIAAISDRATWDSAHIKATIQAMTAALSNRSGPKTLEDMVAESMEITPIKRIS